MRVLALLTLASALLWAPGCATQNEDPDRVSTIPWNRPQSWEGQGPLGGMAPGTR